MVDYEKQCAWCGSELGGRYITFLPAFNHQLFTPGARADRYCSPKCVTARRADLFGRSKLYDENWPRWGAQIPPELDVMIETAAKHALGVNVSSYSRANVVRAALRMYLDAVAPIPDAAVESTAEDASPELPPCRP